MKRPFNKCAFFLVLIIACGYANGRIAKREASKDENIGETIKSMINSIPWVGKKMIPPFQKLIDGFNEANLLSNHILARIAGGALPCEVNLNGISCSGITTKSDMADLVAKMISPIPDVFYPQKLKNYTVIAVKMIAAPVIDTMMGGMPEKKPE